VSDHNTKCPLCGMNRLRPRPIVATTAWSDVCGCCDDHFCMYHRCSTDDPPARPSEDVMRARAKARCARDLERWEALRRAFEAFAVPRG
jgi:hypothetical protein